MVRTSHPCLYTFSHSRTNRFVLFWHFYPHCLQDILLVIDGFWCQVPCTQRNYNHYLGHNSHHSTSINYYRHSSTSRWFHELRYVSKSSTYCRRSSTNSFHPFQPVFQISLLIFVRGCHWCVTGIYPYNLRRNIPCIRIFSLCTSLKGFSYFQSWSWYRNH